MFENIKLGYRLINVNNAAFDVAAKVEESCETISIFWSKDDCKIYMYYIDKSPVKNGYLENSFLNIHSYHSIFRGSITRHQHRIY